MKRPLKSVAVAVAGIVLSCFAPLTAQAANVGVTAKVTFLEATYMPGQISLKIDAPLGACAAGTFLIYYPQGADAAAQALNIQAVFSMLLTAKVSNLNVVLTSDSASCAAVHYVSMN